MPTFKKLFLSFLVILILFLCYDYFFTHYFQQDKDGKIKEEVLLKTGLSIRKPIFTTNNSHVKTYIDGKEAFPAIESLIQSAQKTLFVETFIFHYDKTGIKIANLLGKAKLQGIDVKVIIDSTGIKFAKNDYKIVDLLKQKNVDVKVFNKNFLSETGLNITHRKIILVDGFKVMTGGMNFGDEYKNEWHDSMFEMSGQVTQDIQKEFLYDWRRSGGILPKNILGIENKKFGDTQMKVITTSVTPDSKSHEIHNEFIKLINGTKKNLMVMSPYFSDDEVINAIIKAKKRNVNVVTVMPKHNNHSVFRDLNLYTAKKFVDQGIDTYFYKPSFSHLKSLISDDTVIIGSANIDERSFTGNQELCIVVKDKIFSEYLQKELFEKDIKNSEKANKENTKMAITQKTIIKTLEALDYYL